jgi:hypothetical protein
MAVIEILAYTPSVGMNDFLKFVVEGKPNGQGDYETDDQGRKIVGVFRWLHGRGVPHAHFFNSVNRDDFVQMFASTVERLEGFDVPWMRRIPGFEAMVKADGMIGKAPAFSDISVLLASVKSNKTLDDKIAAGNARVQELLKKMEAVQKIKVLAALRGEVGSNTGEVFEDVKNVFKVDLGPSSDFYRMG